MEEKNLLEKSNKNLVLNIKETWEIPSIIDLDVNLTEGGMNPSTTETTSFFDTMS